MARGGSTIGEKALMMTTAGYAPETVRLPGFVEHTSRPIQLIDILPTSRTGRGAVSYMEETTRAHAAAEIAEGGAYRSEEHTSELQSLMRISYAVFCLKKKKKKKVSK